jgi:hypothetical protein
MKKGMPAKFEGECPACGQMIYVGEMIEKIPQLGDKRGHLQCYQRMQGTRPTQTHVHPAQAQQQAPSQQQQPYEHPAHRPATVGPRATSTSPASVIDDVAIHELWQLREAMTMISQGAMRAAVAIETIVKAVDPHHVKETRGDDKPLRAVN